jgi:signal transduction histidine kinase
MLGDLAEESESRDELKGLLDRSRDFAKRSITAVRYCTNTLEGRGLCKNLPEDMRRSAGRLLADMEYQLSFEGEAFLVNLNPRKRVDLFFFFKECLANIIRHSGATQANSQLKVTPEELTLTITDNGIGLPDGIPDSLKRRAHMLGAKLSVERAQESGTRITLNLNLRKWKLLK